jgi:fumarylpyruvate hydrolase
MFVIPAPPLPSVAVAGESARFPVHRIYCVGRNYADHAREMGAELNREQPTFFLKPADAVVESGSALPYPPGTRNLHHEVELVLALGSGGSDIAVADALAHVYGYAVGLDLTRRDLQTAAKQKGPPSRARRRSATPSAVSSGSTSMASGGSAATSRPCCSAWPRS